MATDSEVLKIGQIINKFAGDNEELAKLLAYSVGRVLIRDMSTVGKVHYLSHEDMRHIHDWLKAALVNDAAWLRNVDENGRPRKLMKLSSIQACVAEADKEMKKAATRRGRVVTLPDDERLLAELGDGYTLVRLLAANALDREGVAMRHCIGDGAYDEHLDDEDHLFLSLRDPFGRAQVTLEIESGSISQVQGKRNNAPEPKCMAILAPYFSERNWQMPGAGVHWGYVVDKNGTWVPVHEMYDGIEIDGDVELSRSGVRSLPNAMVVNGDLGMMGTEMEVIEGRLTVGKDADFTHSSVRRVSGDVRVGGSLMLNGSSVEELPEDLTTGQDLMLHINPIADLPRGLKVGGCLSIHMTNIAELPDDIEVGDAINMEEGQISEFPDTLSDDLVIVTFVDGEVRREILGDIRAREARPVA